MNPYRALPRIYRITARINLWFCAPAMTISAGINAALAPEDPLKWLLVGVSLLASVLFVFAGVMNFRTAATYEEAADIWDDIWRNR